MSVRMLHLGSKAYHWKNLAVLHSCGNLYSKGCSNNISKELENSQESSDLTTESEHQEVSTPDTESSVQKISEHSIESGTQQIPAQPTTCCMSGCPNCVWLDYAEELRRHFLDGNVRARKAIERDVQDPNLKAFLLFELQLKGS
ncbi:UNVERIFIED_CONTAM: hypothetical protein GTU68_006614 [Idotea baltica]|nr:hypothetical protein [Idotea baltica]